MGWVVNSTPQPLYYRERDHPVWLGLPSNPFLSAFRGKKGKQNRWRHGRGLFWRYLNLVINSDRFVTEHLFMEGYLQKTFDMQYNCFSRGQLKCNGTRAETRFHLSAKRTSPFKLAGASVQSTTGSRGVRISDSNAGYTMFRGSVKGTGYPLNSPVSPFTSPPVRHRVPSHFNWSLPQVHIAAMLVLRSLFVKRTV